jgi:hypothetical protein
MDISSGSATGLVRGRGDSRDNGRNRPRDDEITLFVYQTPNHHIDIITSEAVK